VKRKARAGPQFRLAVLAILLLPTAMSGRQNQQNQAASARPIRGEEHYAVKEGLRIYLWEKHRAGSEARFAASGKVALLVHGGTFSGRPDFDLQIRDYSLMDFLARNDYDVWAIDIHGYGHSDKTDQDWSDVHSAAADIAAAVEYISKLRGVSKVDLLGWSAGTQRAGLFAMQHPERVAKLILYAPHWKGTEEYRSRVRKRIENGGQPLTQYRINTEAAARSDFVEGELAQHPQFEEDVVEAYVKAALETDPQSPNAFVDNAKLPILDPLQITVPTMIIHGERDYAAKEEDLVPFFSQLKTHEKQYVLLPDGGHALMLEKDHRRFQHEVLSFLDRP
jgi:pimeloyl-ACP methyl ester carboxylesterase